MKIHKLIYVSGKRSAFLAPNFHSFYLSQRVYILLRHKVAGLRFDVMNKLNAHGGLFVGQKVASVTQTP